MEPRIPIHRIRQYGSNDQLVKVSVLPVHDIDLRLPADVAKTGRRIPMNANMLETPVLRRMDKRRVTNNPVQTIDIQPQIRRLGQFCGFENCLVAHCLRRGVAYSRNNGRESQVSHGSQIG
ncbi:hypothetical protein P153DRAFT_362012 [Dothidotthia symphoricarpi CBS 119687]|uniref:Uncharacterized protein n=1 Tax=Dothidotthia symphoricarpi CBS 119687 TaxID=1392245 RepID=A0A6A5ZVB9_9PLEO|nr:uncharacterized protein P153DRAFT_362012 [Dothidotthia symphoricarpi CBS 119687]KAF2123449.1 hypothetical protein P153DRAFT_362012 [Dothidotthia symphoricarpi CBS 119687]